MRRLANIATSDEACPTIETIGGLARHASACRFGYGILQSILCNRQGQNTHQRQSMGGPAVASILRKNVSISTD
jgi:hypothetical protein